jgi:tetratricopeptide (TPR) repeat protein
MFNKNYLSIVLSLTAILILIRCSSQEYTSAKLYIQQREWEKAEENLLKAIIVEPENSEIYYQLGYHIYALQKKDWKVAPFYFHWSCAYMRLNRFVSLCFIARSTLNT